MKRTAQIFSIILIFCACFFCSISYAKQVHVTLLQANDVYEMSPVNGGEFGGLARLQTINLELKKKNKHTYTVLAGDLISPSAIGTAKVNGVKLGGRQMIDILNEMKWDFITLGNHEFDLDRDTLIARLNEARFNTISSNVVDTITGQPFSNTKTFDIIHVNGIKIGLAGITLESLAKNFVTIKNPFESAQAIVKELRENQHVDMVVLITHQDINDDIHFANSLKGVDLIVGGHEHENIYLTRGVSFTPIAKADANARSVYIHDLFFDTKTKKVSVKSQLKVIDATITENPKIQQRVNYWRNIAFDAFRADGFKPEQNIVTTTESLDGLESSVRNGVTKLTDIVARSALHAFPDVELSIFNAGSIRIDDVIPVGAISQYDVIRILPFGGHYTAVTMPGSLLKQVFAASEANRGTGGFLHYAGVSQHNGEWRVNNNAIVGTQLYKVSIATFLLDSGDKGLTFLMKNPAISRISSANVDARVALIAELEHQYNQKKID